MIKLIVVCHGSLAAGLIAAMELIAGTQEQVVGLALDESGSITELEERIEAAVVERQPGQEALILVDLFGASPFNASARISQRHAGVEVVSGVNLGMLLEVALGRENISLAELAAMARDAGQDSIKVLSEALSQG